MNFVQLFGCSFYSPPRRDFLRRGRESQAFAELVKKRCKTHVSELRIFQILEIT
jgi:hypothetical protein